MIELIRQSLSICQGGGGKYPKMDDQIAAQRIDNYLGWIRCRFYEKRGERRVGGSRAGVGCTWMGGVVTAATASR
jgi:hypothetical protein